MSKKQPRKDVGKRLFIELGTPMQVFIEKISITLPGELIGMDVGKYIIVKVKGMDKTIKEQIKDNSVEIKYIHVNEIFGFHSSVISIIDHPEELVFLNYPTTVDNYNIRSNQRIDCFLPVEVEFEQNRVNGTIVDINTLGCRCLLKNFSMAQKPALNVITLHLQSTNFKQNFKLVGNVISIKEQDGEISIGVMFDNLDVVTQAVIHSIVPTLELHKKLQM